MINRFSIPLALLVCMLSVSSLFSQEKEEITTFHRLLIFNADEEMMVVKIKDTDIWVTPGHYQIPEQSPRAGMDSIAATYGIALSSVELKGIFMLTKMNSSSTRLRNVYTANATAMETQLPEIIEEVSWLPVSEALDLISFAHINLLVDKVCTRPDAVWGGTVMSYKEEGISKAKMTEEFYPLFERN